MSKGPAKFRWFAFSLRTMFIMVAMLCLAISWVTYQVRWVRERHSSMELLRGRLTFANGTLYKNGNERFVTFWVHVKIKPAPWSLRVLGEPGAGYLIFDLPDSGPELTQLRSLFPEASIYGRP